MESNASNTIDPLMNAENLQVAANDSNTIQTTTTTKDKINANSHVILLAFAKCVALDMKECVNEFIAQDICSFTQFKVIWQKNRMSAAFHVEFRDSTPSIVHQTILQQSLDMVLHCLQKAKDLELNMPFIMSLIGYIFVMYASYSMQLGEIKYQIAVDPVAWGILLQLPSLLQDIALNFSAQPAVNEAIAMLNKLEKEEQAFMYCLVGFGNRNSIAVDTAGKKQYLTMSMEELQSKAAKGSANVYLSEPRLQNDLISRLSALSESYASAMSNLNITTGKAHGLQRLRPKRDQAKKLEVERNNRYKALIQSTKLYIERTDKPKTLPDTDPRVLKPSLPIAHNQRVPVHPEYGIDGYGSTLSTSINREEHTISDESDNEILQLMEMELAVEINGDVQQEKNPGIASSITSTVRNTNEEAHDMINKNCVKINTQQNTSLRSPKKRKYSSRSDATNCTQEKTNNPSATLTHNNNYKNNYSAVQSEGIAGERNRNFLKNYNEQAFHNPDEGAQGILLHNFSNNSATSKKVEVRLMQTKAQRSNKNVKSKPKAPLKTPNNNTITFSSSSINIESSDDDKELVELQKELEMANFVDISSRSVQLSITTVSSSEKKKYARKSAVRVASTKVKRTSPTTRKSKSTVSCNTSQSKKTKRSTKKSMPIVPSAHRQNSKIFISDPLAISSDTESDGFHELDAELNAAQI